MLQLPPLTSQQARLRRNPAAEHEGQSFSAQSSHDGQSEVSGDDPRRASHGGLLVGLRHLGKVATAGHGAPRRLQPISTASRLANETVQEVNAEMRRTLDLASSSDRPRVFRAVTCDDPMGQCSDAASIAGAAAAFESLVSQIETSLQGGAGTLKVLRNGQCMSERVPPRGHRRYKVPLPIRPTEITVSVNLTGGRAPFMWGSTRDPHPGSNSYEFKGKQNTLVYRHVIPAGGEDVDAGIDRRHTAPNCRELHLTLEAPLGECQYDISVVFGRVHIALTRQELAAQVAKIKRTWECRVHELQRDPLAREDFESHVDDLKEADVKFKRKLAGGLDFVNRNKVSSQKWSARSKAFSLHKRALQNYARHDECSRRRAELPSIEDRRRRPLQQCGTAVCHTPVEAVQAPAIFME